MELLPLRARVVPAQDGTDLEGGLHGDDDLRGRVDLRADLAPEVRLELDGNVRDGDREAGQRDIEQFLLLELQRLVGVVRARVGTEAKMQLGFRRDFEAHALRRERVCR